METASHAWWFLRAPLDGIHVQGFRETPRDTFTFFLTGFRQRTENVTFASYNKGGSVKAVKKKIYWKQCNYAAVSTGCASLYATIAQLCFKVTDGTF